MNETVAMTMQDALEEAIQIESANKKSMTF